MTRTSALAALAGFMLTWVSGIAIAETKLLPAGTRFYLVTDKEVTSARGDADVGAIVPCRVWRDVEAGATTFIKSGTPANCRVDKVKRRNMGGIQGRVSVAGTDTRATDGQQVMLQGGYNKEGSGRKAVVWTVGLLLLWPVLFVPGGAAELPPGTVFDVSTVNEIRLEAESTVAAGLPPRLNLTGLVGSAFSAEVLLDEFLQQEKPELLKLKVRRDEALPAALVIDSVNGRQVDPIALKLGTSSVADGTAEAIAEIRVKPLAKHFQKGINRFEVAFDDGGQRRATEVILDVQM